MTQVKEMLIRDFKVTDEYALIDAGMGLDEAARRLLGLQKGVLLVKSEEKVLGVIFDKAILKPIAEGKNPVTMKVEDIMNTNLVFLNEDDKFGAVMGTVEERKPAAIVVTASDGKFRGYFSPVDFREALVRMQMEEKAGGSA